MKISGAVTLYHPNEKVLKNIFTYLKFLNTLYVLDNSEEINPIIQKKLKSYPNVRYIAFHDNKGIAAAFNYVLESRINTEWLLTMDQDSYFDSGMVKRYFDLINENKLHREKVAIYSLNYTGLKYRRSSSTIVEVDDAITSGSVLNVKIAREIGAFDENLFIDEVDFDYCHRIKKCGYKIFLMPNITMHHTIGNPRTHRLLWKKYISGNHAPLRKYYMVRNCYYMAHKFREKKWHYYFKIIKIFIKVGLGEENKKNKFKFMIHGIQDAKRGIMGKFSK